MSTNDCTKHEGIVERITTKSIFVSIVSRSACSSCGAKESCTTSESVNKTIEVRSTNNTFQVGDKVNVLLNHSLGIKAIIIGYANPFMLFIIALIVMVNLTGNELKAGIASLLVITIYFLSLRLFRVQLEKAFHFEIEKYN